MSLLSPCVTPTLGVAGGLVIQADTGDVRPNPLSLGFGLFLDRMIGPDFAAGLAKLKTLCEKTS